MSSQVQDQEASPTRQTKRYRVALVTQTANTDHSPQHHDDNLLKEQLSLLNIDHESPAWDDISVDWSKYDLILPRTTLDYSHKMN